MAHERFNRWQGLAINQLSVAVALISGLAISSLAVALSLLQNRHFAPAGYIKFLFACCFPSLFLAALLAVGTVVSRLLDFRLTARKVRKAENKDYARSLTICGLGPEAYSSLTWLLFWTSCVALLIGSFLLCGTIVATYASRL
jgi:glycerol uptake facilitator-like aquaporin